MRQEYFPFKVNIGWRYFAESLFVTDNFIKTEETDWLKASLDEIMLKSASPSWTKDEWAFRPVELRGLPDITVPQNTGSQQSQGPKQGLDPVYQQDHRTATYSPGL